MDTDIRDEIDRSFGDGPPIDDLDLLLSEGHRAVRRRRLAETGSVLLVAGVVAALALVSAGGTPESNAPTPAGPATATVAPMSPPVVPDAIHPDVVAIIEEPEGPGPDEIWLDEDGYVHTRPGVEVVRTIAHPYERPAIETSAAVEYVRDGATYWFVGALQTDGASFATGGAAQDDLTFEQWVARSAPVERHHVDIWPGRTDLDLVRFDGSSERLVPVGTATILQQRSHPNLPDSFATAPDQSAAAEVELDGERWYVLARKSAGSPPQYIAVSSQEGGSTFEEFLAMAEQRYAEGGGGLL